MANLDIAIVCYTALGLVLGYVRGMGAELRALAGWLIAVYGAKGFAPLLAQALPASLPVAWLMPMAYVLLFLGLRIGYSFVAALLFSVLDQGVATGASRSLGALIGVARALFQMLVLTLVFTWLGLAATPTWKASHFMVLLEQITQRVLG